MHFIVSRLGIRLILPIGVVAGLASAIPAAPVPFYEFTFNEAGTTAVNSGSVDADGTLRNATVVADLHSADGHGVSGLAGDRAFDNSASTGMGSTGTGGRVTVSAATSLHGAQGLSVAGWFKTDGETKIGSSAYLIDLGTSGGAKAGFAIAGGTGASIRATIYGQAGAGTSDFLDSPEDSFADTQQWIFIAVTYDSTIPGEDHNFKIYKGTTEDDVTLVASERISVGLVAMTELKEVSIGNVSGAAIRPFDGFIDDVRVYNSALSLDDLSDVRALSIPEPASAAFIAMGAGLALARRR